MTPPLHEQMKTGVTILREELEKERGYDFTDSEWLEYMDNSITIATFRAMEKYAQLKTPAKDGMKEGG